jgi:hypothetical protein
MTIILFCLAENVAGHHEQKIEAIEKHINTTTEQELCCQIEQFQSYPT